MVYDGTGNADSMNAAIGYVAHGGPLVLVSVEKDEIAFPDPEFRKRDTTVVGSRNPSKQDFDHVMSGWSQG